MVAQEEEKASSEGAMVDDNVEQENASVEGASEEVKENDKEQPPMKKQKVGLSISLAGKWAPSENGHFDKEGSSVLRARGVLCLCAVFVCCVCVCCVCVPCL